MTAQVAGVDRPLLSVAQIVGAGCKVVFDVGGSYIEDPHKKERLAIESKGGLYTLKMWVPKSQPQQSFPRRG